MFLINGNEGKWGRMCQGWHGNKGITKHCLRQESDSTITDALNPVSDYFKKEKILSLPFWKPFALYLGWSRDLWQGPPSSLGSHLFPAVGALALAALWPFLTSQHWPLLAWTVPTLLWRLVLMSWIQKSLFPFPCLNSNPSVLLSSVTHFISTCPVCY